MNTRIASLAEVFKEARFNLIPEEEPEGYPLDQLFTRERMWRGFRLSFGANRAAFAQTVEGLGLPSLLETGDIDILKLMAASGSSEGFTGFYAEAVKDLSLVDGLEALQADYWDVGKEDGMYPRISTQARDGIITSRIVLGPPWAESDDSPQALQEGPDEVGVVLSLRCRYLPSSQKTRGGDFAYRFHEIREAAKQEIHHDTAGRLMARLALAKDSLVMPSSDYSLGIGPLHRGGGIVGFDFGICGVGLESSFDYDGRLAIPASKADW